VPITTSWVRFDELMERASGRETTVIDDATYKCVGVRWYGKGAFVRETPIGMDIGRKQQWIIRKGDVVYNKLFAWKGAFAVADDEVDGCIVSDKFPLYRIREDRLIPAYLKYYFATAELAKQAELLSKGAAAISKLTLNPPQFWDLKLQLPSLSEQRRVVEHIEGISKKSYEVTKLRMESQAELDGLCRSLLFANGSNTTVRLSELVSLRKLDTTVERQERYSFAGVYCFGRGVFKSQEKDGTAFAYDRLTKIRAGDFVYPKLMAWEGALGAVPEEYDGLFVSPEFPVFSVNTERVLPDVLDVYFKTPSVWPLLAQASSGTNVRRRRLHPSAFLNLSIPLPPMATQIRIRNARKAVNVISKVRHESEEAVNSLVGSLLNKLLCGKS
jgi:type I restriction enzyme S subunit